MARVNVICRNYQGAHQGLNRRHQIEITPWKFFAATMTLGFQRFRNFVQAGPRLWFHRMGQGLSGISYLTTENGGLSLAANHGDLDGSEKGGMSYWQGMAFAKLAAAEVLGVRWLQHADAMEKRGQLQRNPTANPANAQSRKRADMVGQDDQGQWHVVEAKGFSSHPGLQAFRDAKIQAGMVGLIDNNVPVTSSACVACLWKKPIEIVLDDPPPFGKERWSLGSDGFWECYYGGLVDYIRDAKKMLAFDEYPGFTFASLTPLLGIIHRSKRPPNWETPMIGLPAALLNDVSLAPKIVPRLFANGALDNVAEDGVALVGSLGDFN